MYDVVAPGEPISQGDILDDCPLLTIPIGVPPAAFAGESDTILSRAVVLTQACDLAQAKVDRVVVAAVRPCEAFVSSGTLKPGAIRDHLRHHRMPGLYFLPTATNPVEFSESIVDMRELHTLPRSYLEALAASGRRVCRILTPYREHLAQHFAVSYMRIGLPEPYETEP